MVGPVHLPEARGRRGVQVSVGGGVATAPPVAPSRDSSLGYRPALDGLRAIAVLAVIGYHFDYGWLQGGFLGVDIFFVLSGYLITSLLLAEHTKSGAINFVAFWYRRAKRLLPALFLMLIAVSIWIGANASPFELPDAPRRSRLDALLRRQLALHRERPGLLRPVRLGLAAASHLVARDRGAVLSRLANSDRDRTLAGPPPSRGRGHAVYRGHRGLGPRDGAPVRPGRPLARLLRHRCPCSPAPHRGAPGGAHVGVRQPAARRPGSPRRTYGRRRSRHRPGRLVRFVVRPRIPSTTRASR